MNGLGGIDLSQLTPPPVVEILDYESILAALKADLTARYTAKFGSDSPEVTALEDVLALESEPLTKLLEVSSYREIVHRARVNDAAKSLLLAYAIGADLDHLAALFGVTRLTDERDNDLRIRVQLAIEAYSVAGPSGAYLYYALTADPDVKAVDIFHRIPGLVEVCVMSNTGDGTASAELVEIVRAALRDDTIRPICDGLLVRSTAIQPYTVAATLTYYDGPDAGTVKASALAAVQRYAATHHRSGHDINRSGLFAALHQPGVYRVDLTTPAADLTALPGEAWYCTAITLADGGIAQ